MKIKEIIIGVLLVLAGCSSLVCASVYELEEMINPDSITVGSDYIYITSFPSVYIYSLKDYRLIKKFGRRGEGPQEWLKFALLSIQGNQLVISDRNKMLFFSLTGDYIKEIKAKSTMYWGGRPTANGFIARDRTEEHDFQYNTLWLYDQNLQKTKEIYRSPFFWQYKKSSDKCDAIDIGGIHFQVYRDYIIFIKNRDFAFDVFDQTGKKLFTIQLPYSRLPFPGSLKEQYHQYFQTTLPWKRLYSQMSKEIHFPGQLPAIRDFIAVDDKIYVLTYETRQDQSKFIILDLQGKKLREVWLPLCQSAEWFQHSLTQWVGRDCSHPTFTIKNNLFYQLLENEDTEQWELQVTGIEVP